MQTSFTTNTRGSVDCTNQEEFRNAATTKTTHLIQQQLPSTNEFASNLYTTEKVSGKPPQPAVKTYIAKLSYGNSNANRQNIEKRRKKDLNSENLSKEKTDQEFSENLQLNVMESSKSSQLLEDFSKKKQEREQEIREIQEMLNKIKSPQKLSERSRQDSVRKAENNLKNKESENEEVEECPNNKEENKPVYRRSNSELSLKITKDVTNPRITRRDTARTTTTNVSTNKPRSKSAQLPLSSKECKGNHKKSYNPEDARRYMEMRKKQRKFGNFNDAAIKSKIEKEEIKKRLEELKKNTRKLVSKNIQKKEKITTKNLNKTETESKNINKNNIADNTEKFKEKSCKELKNNLEKATPKKSNSERSNKETKGQEISQRSNQSLNNVLKPSGFPLLETNKRIGLLRKAENDKDFSFTSHRNFNFDKENQNLEQLTQQLTNSKENKQNKETNKTPNNEQTNKKDKIEQGVQTSLKELTKPEEISDLDIPASNLKTNQKEEHSIHKELESKEANKTPDLPYWLRPSAAQVYPYNFIMAVRRKLEAIAEPMASNSRQRNQETSTTGLISLTKHKKRKSLEMLDDKRNKKLKKKQEENVVEKSLKELHSMKECSNLKQLKPLPQSHEKSLNLEKQQKESCKKSLKEMSEDPVEPLTQFKYLQKSLEKKEDKNIGKTKSFYQTADIPPFRPSALQKSLQNLSSQLEDKQTSLTDKLSTKHKSIDSINSEINSNLSSISLQLPISNTLTEVSSLRTESRRTFNHCNKPPQLQTEDDISSLSSQIFSSPEKKTKIAQQDFEFVKPRPVSPQIFSSPEKHGNKATEDFEFVKPRPVSPLSLEKVQKLKIKRKECVLQDEKEDKEMDFSQLLEDFNRSLSQVIQVNEQLKCTLDKSQQILSPHSSKKSTETDRQYTSDFEKSSTKLHSSLESDKLKQSLQKNNENLKQRKRQLFEMAEKVKPLLTPQKLKETAENGKPLPELNLDLNLKSLNNSTETSEAEKPSETEIEDEEGDESSSTSIAKQSYEKRLNEIEKLKMTLKQTILESKEKRKEREGNKLQTAILTEQNYNDSKISKDSNKTNTQTQRQSQTESEIPSEIETQSEKSTNPTKISSKSTDTNKHVYKDYKNYEKYQKQFKNSLTDNNKPNSKISDYENISQSSKTENIYQKQTHSETISKQKLPAKINIETSLTKSYSLHSKPGMTDITKENISNYRTSNDVYSNYTKSPSKKFSSKLQKDSEYSETETYSATQSEMGSTKSQSAGKINKPLTASITSSIAEELQNTYETASQDNENIPLTSKSKVNSNKNRSLQQESSRNFIKSHINRSRGDFQETVSKEAQLNETNFQQAVEAASQISSSEFVQSADDEITSSVASKSYHKSISNPPSYNAVACGRFVSKTTSSPSKTQRRISIGSEIVKFFTEYDCERAERRMAHNDSMSESSLNYSNVGLYDKLIQNETNKSQHLTALLKMREKALLDRTKGQIAWLEVQKARYKAKGLINHIAAIKKKQRGILLKMEKEREEIKRLLQTTTANSKVTAIADIPQTTSGHKVNSQHNTPTKAKKEKLLSTALPVTKPKVTSHPQIVKTENAICATPILKATYELESSQALEELLKKREEDLRKRREHVERLMQWHQRLDEEEAEVLNLERQLLSYNNVPHMVEQLQQPKLQTTTHSASTEKLTPTVTASLSPKLHEEEVKVSTIKSPEKKRASRARKMEKRLKEIDKSLRELSHISASSTTSVVMGQTNNEREDSVSSVATQEVDYVRTTGMKLNKLWKRLTSQQIEKFEPTRRYKLCKSDLERLYEEAKMAVLRDFAEDEERIAQELLEKSASNISSGASPTAQVNLLAKASESQPIEVPALNLNFSSGHSEPEEESANNSLANVTQQGNYSPSVAEENFKAHTLLNSSASSETASEKQTSRDDRQTSRLENNVQMFLALSQRIQATTGKRMGGAGGGGLQRSLSDTEISDVPKFKADKTTTSQKNIATIASQSNSSITTNSSARSYDASGQHQRSKSSIVEMTNIPSTQTETITNHTDSRQTTTSSSTLHTDNHQDSEPQLTPKDLEDVMKSSNIHITSRSSVICSIGAVTPIKLSQQTSSEIATITEDTNSSSTLKTKSITKDFVSSKTPTTLTPVSKQKSTYSAQFGTDSSSKAKEISTKLEEISAAVTQLSQMNALPSYESVTQSHTRNKSIEEPIVTATDESNLSTDASSYSFNFDHITTDKHSSPGTSSSLASNSLKNKTLTSKTYTKDLEHQQTLSPLYTNSNTSNSLNSTKSKTFVKDDNKLTSQTLTQSNALENRILDTYEADFESDLSNVTHIEDITIPTFETTNETIQEDEDGEEEIKSSSKDEDVSNDQSKENVSCEASDKTYNAEELKNKTYTAEDVRNSPTTSNEKYLTAISAKNQKPSPDRELLPPPPLPPPPPPPTSTSSAASNATATTSTQNGNQLMPDIINELELRRHQLILDNEQLKQYEHVTAVPYMYVREIPNKPPPPYVPPAHGSPMTTIFPSEDRIKDITYRRTHELYCELLKTDYCNEKGEKLPSVNDEQITNIYERIILDICREYLEEHAEILRDGDPINFHSQLAFFNPPNRLKCIQDAIYKEVRSCLAMDKVQPKRTQIYSVYGQRAKQDHIGKIIIQEMYDEDDRWCNFHREESEVLHLMVEEMINKNINEIAKEVLVEEGGSIEEDVEITVEQTLLAEESNIVDENEANHQVEDTIEEDKVEEQSQLLQSSSVLVETLNEDDKTYCVSETKQEYTVLNQTNSRIDASPKENVNNSSGVNSLNATTPNAVQTCT